MVEGVTSVKPFLAVLVSLFGALLISLTGEKSRNLRESWTILAAVAKFLIVASMLPLVLEGKIIEYTVVSIVPGLSIAFKVDALGIFFATTSSFLWIITSFYSIGYMRALKEHAQTRYFICFAISLSAAVGIAFSANLFTLFLFYELLSVITYPLVIHHETPEAIKNAKIYLVYLLGTSLSFMLFAIFITFNIAGTLDFADQGLLHGIRGTGVSDGLLIATFILFMAGITKAALIPLHSWLPAAMVAPTPVSALLHAVAVVKAGVFTVLKVILHVFGIDLMSQLGINAVFPYVASFTIIVASIIALRQDSLKKRLAYSTVSQLSYVILGASLLTTSAVTGGIMHIVIHAFGKITLFFTAGAIYVASHKTHISQLDGIGKRMPFTMAAFTLGSLSMIGVPPLGGFLSKWYIAMGAISAEQLPIVLVLATSTILNACYFLPIVYVAFFKDPKPENDHDHAHAHPSAETHGADTAGERQSLKGLQEAPAIMVIPLVLTAIGTIVLFFAPSIFLDLARLVIAGATGGN